MNKSKLHTYPVIICFLSFVLFTLIWSVSTAPKDYNSKEQKDLAQIPHIYDCESFDEFAKRWDAFVSDQFPCRDKIIESMHSAEEAESDTIIDDVYVLSSDYLFTYTYPIDDLKLSNLTKALADKRAKTMLPFVYVIVPQKNLILAEAEPSIGTATDEENTKKLIDALKKARISSINCTDHLLSFPLEDRAKFFYKTDFHWTDYGAFKAAQYIANEMSATNRIKATSIPSEDAFEWLDLTGTAYLGDLQKRFSEEVTVEEYVPVFFTAEPEDLKYYTSIDGEQVPRESIVATGINDIPLDYNKLSTYNLGYIRIENPNAREKKSVLVLKDSYECCLTDYLSELFTEVNIVDPRAACPSFDEISSKRKTDLVLLMYHNSNVSTELIQYLK